MTDRSWAADLIQAITDLIQGRSPGGLPPDGPTIPVEDPARIPTATESVGVIFVHGIGTQPPRETFLNWSNPIVEMLAEWRRGEDEDAGGTGRPQIGENPVKSGAVERENGGDERAWTTIAIPATPGHEAKTWLITEAFWAGSVRAPSFAQTMRYLQTHITAIVDGIVRGYGPREDRRRKRNEGYTDTSLAGLSADEQAQIAELKGSASWRWAWIERLDRVWSIGLVRRLLGWTARTVAFVTVVLYAPFRALPIKAIRDWAELATLDAQLVDAFGDLPVLLDDSVQAAIIRQRLVSTIDWVIARGCKTVVLVAHSGGAIVSFSTLLDPAFRDRHVAKLITLGQGLALGWRLEEATGPFLSGNPIRGDLGAFRPDLRWVDFWGTYDPAPAGPFEPVAGSPLVAVGEVKAGQPASPIQIESRPVTNYMHMAKDHDGYWPNDEGFLVPLVRHLDDPLGDGTASRFYTSRLGRTVRIERRRRRVGLLLGWRWLALTAAVAAVLIALVPDISIGVSLTTTGDTIAAIWGRLPAHEILTVPIDSIGDAFARIVSAFGPNVREGAAWLGPLLLGAFVPIAAVFVIYSRGVAAWGSIDASERKAVRRERLRLSGSGWAKSEGTVLVGGLVGIDLAAADVTFPAMLAWLAAVGVVSLVVRRVFRRPSA